MLSTTPFASSTDRLRIGAGCFDKIERRANSFQVESRGAAGNKNQVGQLRTPAGGGVGGGAGVDHYKVKALAGRAFEQNIQPARLTANNFRRMVAAIIAPPISV